VFTSETDSNDDEHPAPSKFWLYTVRADGTHLHKLVEGREAVWSASGRHIRFAEPDGDVAQVEPDGSHYKVLAHQTGYTHSLDLSPDGKHIAYVTASFTDEKRIVEILNVRTRKRTSFRANRLGAWEVTWMPGGAPHGASERQRGQARVQVRRARRHPGQPRLANALGGGKPRSRSLPRRGPEGPRVRPGAAGSRAAGRVPT
jgi:hypothetical protein